MNAPPPPTGGPTDAEIAAALAALLALRSAAEPSDASFDEARGRSAWRRATGPLPDHWPSRGWRGPTRPRSWS